MRILYYYHIPAVNRSGRVFTTRTQALVVEDLARNSEQVVCLFHRPGNRSAAELDTELTSENVLVVEIPPLPNPVLAWILGPMFALVARRRVFRLSEPPSIAIIRGPSTLTGWIGRSVACPIALLVVGDYFDWAKSGRRSGVRRLAASWFSRLLWGEAKRIGRRGAVFLNTEHDIPQWRSISANVVLVSTNSLCAPTAPKRFDTCSGPKIGLLFVGRVEREKGINEAIAAVRMLAERGMEAALTVVGPTTDPTLDLPASDPLVEFVGPVTFGPDLFKYYDEADILLCPSHFEGFPRVLWEAMAFGLPIVASDVGSISTTVGSDVAALVPPHAAEPIVLAVEQMVTNAAARRERIRRGFAIFEELNSTIPTVGEAAATNYDSINDGTS